MKSLKTYIFLFLLSLSLSSLSVYADSYNPSEHTLDKVEDALKNTELSDALIEYKNSAGTTVTLEMTYGEAILAAGAELNLSPVELAADLANNMNKETASPLEYIYNRAEELLNGSTEKPEVTYASYKTTTKVNYRKGAGTSYTKAGSLESGTVIQVETGYSAKADGYTWYRFKNSSGTFYVASEYLTKVNTDNSQTPATPAPETPTVTYSKYKTTTGVNYRDGAGTSYTKKGTLATGTVIEVEDGYSKSANGYTWVRFKNSSGTYYVASQYLTKVASSTSGNTSDSTTTPTTPTVTYTKYKTTTGVNYRNGAGTSYTKIGSLSAGTIIEVEDGYSKSANGYTWVRFKTSSGTYYIASQYITKAGSSTTTSTPSTSTGTNTSTVTYSSYKTTTGVNYRKGAGTSYSKVGSLSTGTVIQVENGYSKTANGYTWVRFKLNGTSYYIALEYLKKI